MTAFISVSGIYCPPCMPKRPFGLVIVCFLPYGFYECRHFIFIFKIICFYSAAHVYRKRRKLIYRICNILGVKTACKKIRSVDIFEQVPIKRFLPVPAPESRRMKSALQFLALVISFSLFMRNAFITGLSVSAFSLAIYSSSSLP